MTTVGLEHVLVVCDDIDRTRDFYCDVVGLSIGDRPPLELDYDALTRRLAHRGVPAVTNVVPGGPRQVFVEDPNGVRVEINVRSSES
jgi:Glyoxalase/Bleomycin resistance protein/Dioxygenase superfamily